MSKEITIRISDNKGKFENFTIDINTPMQKLIDSYLIFKPKNRDCNFCFLYDGKRVKSSDTAETLGLKSNSIIDAIFYKKYKSY